MNGRCLGKERPEVPLQHVPADPPAETAHDLAKRQVTDPGELGLIERYRKGYAGIEVWGRLGSVKVEPRYWRAVFEGALVQSDVGAWVARRGFPPGESVCVKNVDDDEKQTVLVDVVEAVQSPEGVLLDRMRFDELSVIRLAFFECVEDLRAFDRGDQVNPEEVSFLVEGRISDGKLSLCPGAATVEKDKLPREVVEGRSEIEMISPTMRLHSESSAGRSWTR